MTAAACANCDALLTGPYCAKCGQHAHESARTLGALLHEAWHLLTHVDARLLSTLAILMTRPGRLTLEYFAGRRARYMPPFQLYFVVSLVFFGLASVSTHLHPQYLSAALEEANKSAIIVRVTFEDCKGLDVEPEWLSRLLRDACWRQAADNGKSLEREFVASVPKMMFIFLPFMAFIVMLLYRRPRHLYVEHLILFLHAHAALYLAIVLSLLIQIPSRFFPGFAGVSITANYLLAAYGAWYIYASMRRFYGQGRGRTLWKLAAIGLTYFFCLFLTLLGTLLVSALVV